MNRRSPPQAKTDDAAFPVRVLVLVPENGYGTALDAMVTWLRSNIGVGEFAHHPGASALAAASSFYFRCIADAVFFVAAHPEIVLADGTMSASYRSPHFVFGREETQLCNLYSMTRTQDELRGLFAPLPLIDTLGNMPALSQIYPDYAAPILRNQGEGRELAMARWGMPTPPQFLVGKKTDRGVTNVRNTKSSHRRRFDFGGRGR